MSVATKLCIFDKMSVHFFSCVYGEKKQTNRYFKPEQDFFSNPNQVAFVLKLNQTLKGQFVRLVGACEVNNNDMLLS